MKIFVLLGCILMFFNVPLSAQKTQKTKSPHKISMREYRKLYGETEENQNLIQFFEKKHKNATLMFGLSLGVCSIATTSANPLIFIPAFPLIGAGIVNRSQYSKRKLYDYLTHKAEIPPRLQTKIQKYSQKNKPSA